jgi:subtilase family serine protease
MRRGPVTVALASVAAVVATMTGQPAASAAPAPQSLFHRNVHSCAAPASWQVACNAILRETVTAAGVEAPAALTPTGYGPADLRSAYNLPSPTAGSGQTVAIVDAYDDPNAEADLNTYRAQYGIPACATANGCFRKVNQSGGTRYPLANGGWAQEISLDLDMVSAICPNCHILLVEANSPTMFSLGAAVNTAVKLGATAVSNSYGGRETFLDTWYDSTYFNHPGVAITASTGDAGFRVEYPAASRYVTAVGGTRLTRDSSARGWSESVWSTTAREGAGSGCSARDARPTWQSAVPAITAVCARRALADVSAVADPATGVAVYDSFAYQGRSGWLTFGGTSVSSPIIASVYALSGNTSGYANALQYAHPGSLFDITSGSNGTCPTTQWCNARAFWDGPTGLGTPNGTGAF